MRLPLELRLPPLSSSPNSGFAINEETGELVLVELQGELEVTRADADDGADGDVQAGAIVGKLDLSVPVRVLLGCFPSLVYQG